MPAPSEQVLEELLVLEAQGGNRSALEQLVRRWQPRMWRHARLLADDDAAAWDAVQETWEAMARGLRRLDDPADFGPWIMRIVTHKCADAVRHSTRRRSLARRFASQPPPTESPAANNPDEHTEIRAAISTLPESLRSVVSLFYGCGLSVAQIGAALAIPSGTVKSRLSEARTRLHTMLERNKS